MDFKYRSKKSSDIRIEFFLLNTIGKNSNR